MLRRALIALLLPLAVGPAWADSLSARTELYCLDSSGAHQPFNRTDVGRLQSAFAQYMSLPAATTSEVELIFSDGSQSIAYKVEPHGNGVSLLSMKVRLSGVNEDVTGTEMCWRTFGIVNNTVKPKS